MNSECYRNQKTGKVICPPRPIVNIISNPKYAPRPVPVPPKK